MKKEGLTSSRSYEMKARAETAAATGERILDAAVEVFWQMPYSQITLDEIARLAGVSVQTVIRRFGSKDSVLAAAAERESQQVIPHREDVAKGDVAAAARTLVSHYEAVGDRVLKLLEQERDVPQVKQIVDRGRALHRDWCARVFAPALAGRRGIERRRRLAQLVAVCDVYMWKLLRGDAALSRKQTELALLELLEPMTEGG